MAQSAGAQKMQQGYYNYNIYNGMPSNHVYQVIVDTYGYAWIATTKGVLKYNGYTFKKFGFEEGLAREDVWYLIEDNGNKIWLGSISNSFGYIQNNTFKVALKNNAIPVYPHGLQKINDGIAFTADTISKSALKRKDMAYRIRNGILERFVINSSGMLTRCFTFANDGSLLELKNSTVKRLITADGRFVNETICKTDIPVSFIDTTQRIFLSSSRYFIVYTPVYNSIYFIDVNTGAVKRFHEKLKPLENWLTVTEIKGYHQLATNKRIVILDSDLQYLQTYHLKDMMPEKDSVEASFIWFYKHPFWKGFSTTSNMGMYQHHDKYPIRKLPVERMNGAEYVGKTIMSTGYWWNNTSHELIGIKTNGTVLRRVYNDIYNVKGVVSYDGKRDFLYSKFSLNLLHDNTGILENFLHRFDWFYLPDYGYDVARKASVSHLTNDYNVDELLYEYNDTLYVLSGGNAMYKNYVEKDTFKAFRGSRIVSKIHAIDTNGKYLYLSYPDWFVRDHLFTGERDSLSASVLQGLGIEGIMAMCYDNNTSNLYVLAKTGLFMMNFRKRNLQKLPMRLNSIACNMQVDNDNLVINAAYGLCFYKLYRDGSVSAPYYVINYKYSSYKYLHGKHFYIGDSTVVFNTDNGLMSVPIPHDSLYKNNNTSPGFKLTVSYKDKLTQLSSGDTLHMDQRSPVFLFDVINPVGVGIPRFYYYVPGVSETWQQLNGAEWFAMGLQQGSYNKVYIKVMDEGWSSKPVAFYVYVVPYWWQTLSGKALIGFCLLLLIGGVALGVMRITRRRLNRINARKNLEAELKSLRTSMELKSIHAQINPHFIFNTLSTGLYFIKKKRMEEAYDHIAAFSELLRNYIKSSRDKYIVLNEEIDNLKRYVTLQQSRFENLHEFDVEIGEGVNVFAEKIPALLLQPVVENAINHGLFHKPTPGRLLLRFEKNEDGALVCIIDDDGVGREKSKIINAETRHKTQSYGTDLIRELIEAFNKYEPVYITIEYVDKQPPASGTTVILTIKETTDDK